MSRSNSIKSNLADDPEGSEGVFANQQLPQTLMDDDESQAIRIFDQAITATDSKAESVAYDLGIAYQKISDYRTGKRTLAAHRLVRLARKNRAAGISIIRALAKLVGNVEVRERKPVDKSALDRQLKMSLRRNPAALRIALADAAHELGIDEDEAAQIWDEPTLVDAVK